MEIGIDFFDELSKNELKVMCKSKQWAVSILHSSFEHWFFKNTVK